MGLDISVYKKVRLCKEGEEADFLAFVIDDSWLFKIKNLVNKGLYRGELQKKVGLSYPYSSHMRFRVFLIHLIGRDDLLIGTQINWRILPKDLPFIDLIDFADNEGCIDWETAARLYKDFAKYLSAANLSENGYMRGRYIKWLAVFDAAKDEGGVVVYR